ncbi:MAG TPA: hypothetical protein VK697_10220 [Methylomirabilota bacterium]|nr:hypothetical protein [Methylomirabilota bacterium]
MKTRIRRRSVERLAIATAIALPVAIWLATLEGGLILGAGSRGEGCRSFWGETVDTVAWSPAGGFLVVGTHATANPDSGDSAVRVFRWPGMEVVSSSKQVKGTTDIAIDDTGVLAWSTEGVRDSTAILPTPTLAWRLDPGGDPRTSDRGPIGPSRTVLSNRDVSSQGILAETSAPAPDRPLQLCVRDQSAGT